MNLKAIFFDMDGVLTDSMKYHNIAWKKALNTFGIYPTDEELSLNEGRTYNEVIDTFSEKYSVVLSEDEKEHLHKIKTDEMKKIFKIEIYPRIFDVLDFLKEKRIRLALITGSGRRFTEEIIENNFKGIFDVIITSDEVKNGKPSPEPYLLAFEKIDVKKDEIVVIENAPLGIKSAKTAGFNTYAITTTLDAKHLDDAEKIFSSHEELLDEFRKIIH